MSNNQFLSEPPWPKIERSENNFKIAEEEEVAKIFEPKSWEPPIEVVPLESTSQEPEDPEEAEDDLAEPLKEEEPTIQLPQSELEMKLKEARENAELETETKLKAKYEESARLEKEKLIDFFESLMLSKDSNQELSVEVCNLAFKVGELLAKTELLTNRALVTEFVERVINEITEEGEKAATVFTNPKWEDSVRELRNDHRLKHIDFKSDENMGWGSVRISLGNGGIEDTFEDRVAQLRDQIVKAASDEKTNLTDNETNSEAPASNYEDIKPETIEENKETRLLEKKDD